MRCPLSQGETVRGRETGWAGVTFYVIFSDKATSNNILALKSSQISRQRQTDRYKQTFGDRQADREKRTDRYKQTETDRKRQTGRQIQTQLETVRHTETSKQIDTHRVSILSSIEQLSMFIPAAVKLTWAMSSRSVHSSLRPEHQQLQVLERALCLARKKQEVLWLVSKKQEGL